MKPHAIQMELDTQDVDVSSLKLSFLKRRSPIAELQSADDIIAALTVNGVCVAFDARSGRKLCLLNTRPDQVIRSLFYNKRNDSLILISVYSEQEYTVLWCRSISLEYIRRGQPDQGIELFENEHVVYPGFVELDEINGIALTCSAKQSAYKVWSLSNYELLYEIIDAKIRDVKLSSGTLVLLYERTRGHVPIKILSCHEGHLICSVRLLVHRTRNIEFILQFGEVLLYKQDRDDLRILDLRTHESVQVSGTRLVTPDAFTFLDHLNIFLTYHDRTVAVWDFRGRRIATFEDRPLFHNAFDSKRVCISQKQTYMISCCYNGQQGGHTINISHILSGKFVERKKALPEGHQGNETVDGVAAILYNDDLNQLIVGDAYGRVYVWHQ